VRIIGRGDAIEGVGERGARGGISWSLIIYL
jgi:hypothetical protein